MLNRRVLLGSASSAALFGLMSPIADARPVHGGVASGGGGGLPNLTAEITFPGGSPTGSTLVYDIANGTDIGSYVAPTAGFTQRCIRVRHASLANFFVDFRPDVSGGRIEVVFWNGEALGTVASNAYRNLPAYNVVVKLNGVAQSDWRSVSTWSIPYHYWGNRWRWQSALRPVIRTPSQVFSGGFLPNMSLSAARLSGYSGTIVPTAPAIPTPSTNDGKNGNGTAMTAGTAYSYTGYLYLPFMIADDITVRLWGIDCAGDDGSYRDEEGLITKWQADWLLNSTASSLSTFMQQAEFFCCQANAIFLPDQVVGGPINQKADLAHYKANNFWANNYGNLYYTMTTGMSAGMLSGGFSCSISGTTLTVSSSPAVAAIRDGMILKSNTNSGKTYDSIIPGTYIVTQLTGTPGDIGTYQLSQSGSSASSGSCFATTGEFKSKGDEHSPQAWYLPWVITEDPFYIEGAQHSENASIQASINYKETYIGNLNGDATGVTGINGAFTCPAGNAAMSEERGLGWSVKNIASCYRMTPSSGAPSWLLPQSYWSAISSDVSTWIDWQQSNWPTDQYYTVFHNTALYNGDTPQTFYKAYVAYSFGFADLVGLPVPAASGHSAPSSWKTQLTYMFDFIRQITDSTLASGWDVQNPIIHDAQQPGPYYGAALISNQQGAAAGCAVSTSTTIAAGQNCTNTYAGYWTYEGAFLNDTAPYPSNPSPGYRGPNPGNLGPLIAGIAVAKARGVVGATNCFNWINSMIDYSFPQLAWSIHFNTQDGFDGT
jgi:hypothetical protein